ncbi:MAG: PhnD/SsuA/transferrin family substrate-binding protein [Deltaproteobacteria bacterium]|nr:PhnD/SsuA/transferrin family substrate-binding protein [Deltaproteobacteria bacterium]
MLNREVDGGAVKDTVYDRLAKSDPRVKAELAVIHKSGSFPDGTFLFRKGTPAELTTAVKKALLELAKVREGKPALDGIGADRFIETDKRDFSYLAKLVKRMEGK